METFDVVVVGAGAAGMMCAIEAGRRGRRVLAIDHAAAAGEKIRISGGGRCNFTNTGAGPGNFLSANPHFAISALRRYTAKDFVGWVEASGIAYHEKTLGQLFCDGSAKEIIAMLLDAMAQANVTLRLRTSVATVEKTEAGFQLGLDDDRTIGCEAVVVASGGKSIPKMGATGWGYGIAQQFGLRIVETRPALVPLTFEVGMLERLKPLAGVALDAMVAHGDTRFAEAMLFTHRGLSGPAILQISSYWREGDEIVVDMAPGVDLSAVLKAARSGRGKQAAVTVLAAHLPRRLAQTIVQEAAATGNVGDLSDKSIARLHASTKAWRIKPVGSEGYRTAEVTLGGVDTRDLDSRTLAARAIPGLYFVGEVVDVTGWLGGYNFQWAWSSGWVAGQAA